MTQSPELGGAVLERVTAKQLLTDLRLLAGNDSEFADGRSDETGFNLTEGEVIHDRSKLRDEVKTIYSFGAERHRVPRELTAVVYEFGVTLVRAEVSIPPHILSDAYGLDPEEAIEQAKANNFSLWHEQTYKISNRDRQLRFCEGTTYYDDGNDIVHTVSTDDEVDDSPDVTQQQHDQYEALPGQRLSHEKIEGVSPEDELLMWSTLGALMPSQAEKSEREDQLFKDAHTVLRNIRRALLKKAGVQV